MAIKSDKVRDRMGDIWERGIDGRWTWIQADGSRSTLTKIEFDMINMYGPVTEITAARVADGDGDIWEQRDDGRWTWINSNGGSSLTVSTTRLHEVYGPIVPAPAATGIRAVSVDRFGGVWVKTDAWRLMLPDGDGTDHGTEGISKADRIVRFGPFTKIWKSKP